MSEGLVNEFHHYHHHSIITVKRKTARFRMNDGIQGAAFAEGSVLAAENWEHPSQRAHVFGEVKSCICIGLM
jgi:uncharacterized protein YjlB